MAIVERIAQLPDPGTEVVVEPAEIFGVSYARGRLHLMALARRAVHRSTRSLDREIL